MTDAAETDAPETLPATIPSSSSRSLSTLRRKTVVGILRTWRDVSNNARLKFTGEVKPDLPKEDQEFLLRRMRDCLNPKGGEVTARARTVELGRIYLGLTEQGRQRFLRLLATEFDVDRMALSKAMDAVIRTAEPQERLKAERALKAALVSPRATILRQFNTLPNGFKFLVDMRADLLPLVGKDWHLAGLEDDLKQILGTWFDIGLLDKVEISWNSPAALLEKLIAYEAVHKISSWTDLKNRLDADRRCFAFLHPKMPIEPLIFVEVALVKGLAGSVQALLDETSPVLDVEEADTAIFYSISNAQKGLAGISFGNFLIKRVVEVLRRELPQLKHFSTLSPVPGFRSWLNPRLEADENLFTPAERKAIRDAGGEGSLRALLDTPWRDSEKLATALREPLTRLCAQYLVKEKQKGRALDPVAHFHLTNGARLERINWLGDTSNNGMRQSAGIMVNYYYDLSDIDDNHETYVTEGEVVTSRAVKAIL